MRIAAAAALISILTLSASAPKLHLDYTITVNPADTTGFDVTLQIANAPDSFTLAAYAHPEYDDKNWRHISGLTVVDAKGRAAKVLRADSVLWRVSDVSGTATVRYRMSPPVTAPLRGAWRPFVRATGALVGGPTLLYVVGAENAPARVHVDVPAGWKVASGLDRSADGRTLSARNIFALVDSPILIGTLREWRFDVDGVPHSVFYWPLPNATPFDTIAFVAGVEKLTRETIRFWGKIPYRHYTFMFQDGSWEGGLEHENSVTLGAASSELARNPNFHLRETAHEFVHTWNLMQIKPAEYRLVDYKVQPPVAGLWFSEGLTILYADLLRRRAGLSADSGRVVYLRDLLEYYHGTPGNQHFSAEQISRLEYNAPPGALGNYNPSSHLQGEILGTMFDLLIRDATDGKRSMDDVMRLLLERFNARTRGFVGTDIEKAIEDVCACDATPIFERHVRKVALVGMNPYLAAIGMRSSVTWKPVLKKNGQPDPDLRVRAWVADGDTILNLNLWDPNTPWARAGLNSGDQIVTVNGQRVKTWPEFRNILITLRAGDTVRMEMLRAGKPFAATVNVTGYERPVVVLEDIPGASERQRRLRAQWVAGN